MTDESKPYDPSPHKLRRAREEGNVPKSPELAGFVVLLFGLLALFGLIPFWGEGIEAIYKHAVTKINTELSTTELISLFATLTFRGVLLVAPMFALLLVMGVAGNIIQFGFLLSPKAIAPKLSKINPISGFKNVISLKKLLDGALITLKVLVAFGVGMAVFLSFFDEVEALSLHALYAQVLWLREKAMILIGILLVIFCAMAAADYLIKRRQFMRQMRMSFKELQDEQKQMSGDPQIRAKIRAMQRQMLVGKMMSDVPSANVVITNPTHFAVALRLNAEDLARFNAPVLVAKGIDHLAERIKEVAREHQIRIIENPPLARALYRSTDIGAPINLDEELMLAVVNIFHEIEQLNIAQGKAPTFTR